MSTMEFRYNGRHGREDGGPGFSFHRTLERHAARVPSTGEFIRLELSGRAVARVEAVIWEPDGCVTLKLQMLQGTGAVDEASLLEERCAEIPEWWLG